MKPFFLIGEQNSFINFIIKLSFLIALILEIDLFLNTLTYTKYIT
jgi:hypothetical protein